jgi:cell wall-associated NlpC family hydrolase
MRILPTEDDLFDEPDDIYYDDLQDTTLEIGEPVVIYHTSKDGLFYYVQLHNYQGWVKAGNITLAKKTDWLIYVQPVSFLMVVDKEYFLPLSGQELYCQMCTRLPLQTASGSGYTVTAPTRNSQGFLKETKTTLAKSSALHEGYLPYTTNNIIRQAFKFYGNVYGWGGLLNSVDCSSLVYNVYRTMGLYLPRNADEQRDTAGIGTKVEGFTDQQRLAALATLAPGSTIHLGGTHVMIYLGMVNHVLYVIHSASSYEGSKKIYIRQVLVSDLNLHKKNNLSFLAGSNKYMTFR